jgi:hypothetical protein
MKKLGAIIKPFKRIFILKDDSKGSRKTTNPVVFVTYFATYLDSRRRRAEPDDVRRSFRGTDFPVSLRFLR